MARQRWIHPDIWEHEGFGSLSDPERILFVAMFSNADDEGRLVAHPANLRSMAFRYSDVTLSDVQAMRDNVSRVMGCVEIYEVDGREYIQLTSWQERQHPRYPQPSVLPPCQEHTVAPLTQDCSNVDASLRQDSVVDSIGLVRDGLGRGVVASTPQPTATTTTQDDGKTEPATESEADVLAVLRSIPHWPKGDPAGDLMVLRAARANNPKVDLLKVARSLAAWVIDNPGKNRQPRQRFRTWADRETAWVEQQRKQQQSRSSPAPRSRYLTPEELGLMPSSSPPATTGPPPGAPLTAGSPGGGETHGDRAQDDSHRGAAG